MSYGKEIYGMLSGGACATEECVWSVFEKALSHTKTTGQSLESIVYEILESIESESRDEEDLIRYVEILTATLLQHAQDEISCSHQKYMLAHRTHEENIAREYALIDEMFDTLADYAKESRNKRLLKECTSKKKAHLESMHRLCVEIGYNHNDIVDTKDSDG